MVKVEVEINLPSPITVDVWATYCEGRVKYQEAQRAIGKPALELLSSYAGICAVVKVGFVTIKGSDQLLETVKSGNTAGLEISVIGFLFTAIAQPIEAAVTGPLPSWIGGSSVGEPIPKP